jgi:RNA polymerase sigma-70 factor (ECF subfamily)
MFLNRLSKKTDNELMLLISNGEESALAELYARYSKNLIRYFYRMLWKDEAKAQDFLQDLFLKIIERPELFDCSKTFSTWIYSVANNMCKNEYRKMSFRNTAAVSEVEEPETSIESKLDHAEFKRALDKVMEASTEQDRSLLVLRHELEMSFAEIASILDCPEGTAKSRWFYLRKTLAEQLHEFQIIIK